MRNKINLSGSYGGDGNKVYVVKARISLIKRLRRYKWIYLISSTDRLLWDQQGVLKLNFKYLFKHSVGHMWKKLVNLGIYISLCIGVPRDHQNSTPNLYKQGTMPIDEYRSGRGRREIQRNREGSSAVPILELRLKAKISLEPRVQSKSRDNWLFFC